MCVCVRAPARAHINFGTNLLISNLCFHPSRNRGPGLIPWHWLYGDATMEIEREKKMREKKIFFNL